MALLNYLSSGTYSIIDYVEYSKYVCSLRFVLRMFSDNTKTTELASKRYDIGAYRTYQGIISTLTVPPATPDVGDAYVVGIGATGVWEGRDRLIAVWQGVDEWGFWGFAPDQIYYDLVEENYFKMNPATLERIVVYPVDDTRLWNKWFSSALMFSETSNTFKQGYLYLKAQPGFENVIDG